MSERARTSQKKPVKGERAGFHLVVALPSNQSADKTLGQLFVASASINKPPVVPHVSPDFSKTGIHITDLSQLTLPRFNLGLLSANADCALIVVDAARGIEKNVLWAKTLSCLAAIPHIIIAVDNMALVDFSKNRFEALRDDLLAHAPETKCGQIEFLPVDFSRGINIAKPDDALLWHKGPPLQDLLAHSAKTKGKREVEKTKTRSADQFAVHLCWLAKTPMLPGRRYLFDNGQCQVDANISTLKHRLNPQNLEHQAAKRLMAGNIGYANLSLAGEAEFVPFTADRQKGSFVLREKDTNKAVGFGLIKHDLRRATNIRWHRLEIDKRSRATSKQQKPCVLWFTGLSGSGKSAVASTLEKKLHALGKHTYVLDGDNIRHGLCRDLGFTDADRVENLRRISETARLFVEAGLIVIVSFISPFRTERAAARELFEPGEFLEVFLNTPLEVCEQRDPKGLYKKARAGRLKNFTGIDSPYEAPDNPDIDLPGEKSVDELAEQILAKLEKSGLIEQ